MKHDPRHPHASRNVPRHGRAIQCVETGEVFMSLGHASMALIHLAHRSSCAAESTGTRASGLTAGQNAESAGESSKSVP